MLMPRFRLRRVQESDNLESQSVTRAYSIKFIRASLRYIHSNAVKDSVKRAVSAPE